MSPQDYVAPPPSILVIYRASGRDAGGKDRPPWFSKSACFASLLRALDGVETSQLVVLEDLVAEEERRSLHQQFANFVVRLGGVGNRLSLRRALHAALALSEGSSLVYMAEDDYLYTADAMTSLLDAAVAAPWGDYFTLYHHPDRDRRSDDWAPPGPVGSFDTAEASWTMVESSPMTFAARRTALQRDLLAHYLNTVGPGPQSRMLFRAVQHRGPLRHFSRIRPPSVLLSPRPGRATHVENKFLACGVNWHKVNAEAVAWREQATRSA